MSGIHKGWCPSLAHPMQSGDGWLVRLNIKSGKINAAAAREVAQLSVQYGNGQMDLTSRGNLQIRGVKAENYAMLLEALLRLGFTEQARAPRADMPRQSPPLGWIAPNTLALGLLFGRITAKALVWLADHTKESIGLSPWRIVYLHGIAKTKTDALIKKAQELGFITRTDDPRRLLEACPGAPACSSAEGDTRTLALQLARAGKTIHVSGCAKGCACARKTDVVITARNGAYDLAFDGTVHAPPAYAGLSIPDIIGKLDCP